MMTLGELMQLGPIKPTGPDLSEWLLTLAVVAMLMMLLLLGR